MSNIYQSYVSARKSTRMITPSGKPISFADFKFYTQDEEIIAYLDSEIKLKTIGVTKGDQVTSDELNPMEAFRKKVIAEYLQKQEEDKLAPPKDMGSTRPKSEVLNAVTSKQVAS